MVQCRGLQGKSPGGERWGRCLNLSEPIAVVLLNRVPFHDAGSVTLRLDMEPVPAGVSFGLEVEDALESGSTSCRCRNLTEIPTSSRTATTMQS